MTTKAYLDQILNDMIEDVRAPSGLVLAFPMRYTSDRFRSLIGECIQLQKALIPLVDTSPDLLDLSGQVYELEARYRALRARLLLLPSVFLTYTGFIIAFMALRYVDLSGFIKSTFRVDAPERLVTFGIAGAFLYLATSVLTGLSSKDRRSQFRGILSFSIRLLLAILVPIILVSLFFNTEGKLSPAKVTPELLSFACGYSAKLVIDICNKLVEKAGKMVEAV